MDAREEKVQFWMLNVASFLGQLTINMVNLALVYHLRYTLAASATVVGLAASTYTGFYLVCNLLFSKFYQRFRPCCVVATSLIGMGLCAALTTLCRSLVPVFLLLASYGFFMSMLWPQVESWITRGAEGSRLNKLTSAFNFSWSFGTGISPYLTSLLVMRSPSLALWTALGIFTFVAIMVMAVTNSLAGLKAIGPEREYMSKGKEEGLVEDHSTPLRFDSWIAVFVVYSALSVVLNIFPMQAEEVMHIGEGTSGFLLLLRGLATCFGFMVLGRLSFWQFKAWLIYLFEGLFIVLTLAFHRGQGVVATGVYLTLFGLVFAQCYSFSIFHSAAGAVDRGRRMAIHECVLTAGQMIGASFGGGIYQAWGYSDVLLFLSAVAAVALAGQLLVHFIRR